MRRLKIIAALVLFTLTTNGQNSVAPFKENNNTNINYFREHGITRLSDLYEYLPGWNSFSIDGFRWYINSNKTSPDQSQSWYLMLDGQRIDLNALDIKNINLLPVSFAQIGSIESSTSPQLINGVFAERGFININTRKPEKGLSVNAFLMVGNETGDPGPYKYTEYDSENIDIIGPSYAVNLSYGSPGFDVMLGYKSNTFLYPTPDKYVSKRLTGYDFKYRKIYNDGLSLLINGTSLPTKPKLIAIYSTTGKYNPFSSYGSDVVYFPPAAKELPFDTQFLHVGIHGSYAVNGSGSVNYSVKTSNNKMKVPATFEHPDFDWNMINYMFTTEYAHTGKKADYTVGGGVDLNYLKTGLNLSETNNHHYNINGSINYFAADKLTHTLELYGGYDNKRVAFKGSFTNLYKIDDRNTLEMKTAYIQRNITENNDIWNWVNKGYDLFSEASYDVYIANHVGKNNQINLIAKWLYEMSQYTRLSTELFYNKFDNIVLEDYVWRDGGEGVLYPELSSLTSHVDGASGGFTLAFEQKLSSSFGHSLQYDFVDNINGDDLFRELFRAFPKHKVLYRADYSYTDDLFVSLSLGYTSESVWQSFKDLSEDEYINYKIDEKLLCNLSVQKWFLNHNLRTNIILKNIFNQKNLYMPNGAYSDLSLFLTVEYNFKPL